MTQLPRQVVASVRCGRLDICRVVLLATVLVLCLPAVATADKKKTDDILVIVPSDSTTDALSKASLRAVFGMRKRNWQDGSAIKVFVLADANPTHIDFAKTILQTFPYNLRRIWERQVYSGTGQAPTQVSSQEEMLEAVSGNKNAIGYISRGWLNESVKVVEIK